MAKKKEIESTNTELRATVDPVVTVISNSQNKNSLDRLSLEELILCEKAARIICQKYENTVKNYDGSFIQNGDEYNKFKTFNSMRNRIILKLEEKLTDFI